MTHINLEAVDIDGAIREARRGSGDTRLELPAQGRGRRRRRAGRRRDPQRADSGHGAGGRRPSAAAFGKGDIGDPQLRADARVPRELVLQRGHRARARSPTRARGVPEAVTKDENAHVKLLKTALGSARPSRSRSSTSWASPATRPSSPPPRTCSRTPACTPTSGRPATSRTPRSCCAASIVTVEARHSGAIGLFLGKAIAPNGPFDNGLSAKPRSSRPSRRPASSRAKPVKSGDYVHQETWSGRSRQSRVAHRPRLGSTSLAVDVEEPSCSRADLLDVELVEARVGVRLDRLHVPVEVGPARDRLGDHLLASPARVACSKCAGVGRICASSPGSASLGHSRWTVVARRRLVVAPADLQPALRPAALAALRAELLDRVRVGPDRAVAVADARGQLDRLGPEAGDEDRRRLSGRS